MADVDPTTEAHARRTITEFLAREGFRTGRRRVHLVSYPRSGNTLTRAYFSILQGRAQRSAYDGDVVRARGPALTDALDHLEIVKSHQMPTVDGAMIYLVRDGRNATLSFLYMAYLSGGHKFAQLSEVYDAIRHLDDTEGSWAGHLAQAVRQSETRPTLFVRHEDLVRDPEATLAAMTRFMDAEVPAEMIGACVRSHRASDDYGLNPRNGYLYQPEPNSIYDLLKRHRHDDYWRHIFDARSRRYFHEVGGTEYLLRFGYEHAPDWWTQ